MSCLYLFYKYQIIIAKYYLGKIKDSYDFKNMIEKIYTEVNGNLNVVDISSSVIYVGLRWMHNNGRRLRLNNTCYLQSNDSNIHINTAYKIFHSCHLILNFRGQYNPCISLKF